MQFSIYAIVVAAISSGLTSAAAIERRQYGTQTIKWDPIYDNGGISFNQVSCSDGTNGLTSASWPSSNSRGLFSSVPKFSQGSGGYGVAASPGVGGWNSPNCGQCLSIRYSRNGRTRTAWVIAVDSSRGTGVNVGKGVLNYLTDGQAEAFGSISAQVSVLPCPVEWGVIQRHAAQKPWHL